MNYFRSLIADLLHRIGFIEKAGTVIKRIRDEAHKGGYPEPTWESNGFTTAVFRPIAEVRPTPLQRQVGTKSALSRHQVDLLDKCEEAQPLTELLDLAGHSDRTKFRNQVLKSLLDQGLLEMTVPDKPRSSSQRYRLTADGRLLISSSCDLFHHRGL